MFLEYIYDPIIPADKKVQITKEKLKGMGMRYLTNLIIQVNIKIEEIASGSLINVKSRNRYGNLKLNEKKSWF